MKKVIILSGFLFIVFVLAFSFFGHGGLLIDSTQIGIETIIILVFSFYYLYEKLNDTSTLFIYSTYPFWMIVGIVLYLSGSFFTYLFAGSLPKQDVDKYWVITNIFSILKTLFFCIGFIVNSKPTKKIPLSEFDFSSLN